MLAVAVQCNINGLFIAIIYRYFLRKFMYTYTMIQKYIYIFFVINIFDVHIFGIFTNISITFFFTQNLYLYG